MELFRRHRSLIFLLPTISLSFLIGLLLTDIQFDLSKSDSHQRVYYCELIDSFSTTFGIARLSLPVIMCGLAQVFIACCVESSYVSITQWLIIGHLVSLGMPLVAVSLSLCTKECLNPTTTSGWSISSDLTLIHMLMLVLFVCVLWYQTKIALVSLASEQMPSFLSDPVSKPVLIIAGLSYLVAVLISDLLFDLLGNSHFSRTYYCSLKPAVQSDWSRNVPLLIAVIMTAVALSLKVSESHKKNSALFIFELSMISAMLLVCIPLYFKLIQLVSIGCSSPDTDPAGPWPVHKNLLMSHMCVLIILGGSAVAQFVTLIKPKRKSVFRKKF